MAHLINTDITIAQCGRCEAYIYTATTEGIKVTADPQILDLEQYRAALLADRQVYELTLGAQGGPKRLRPASISTDIARARLVAAHGCHAKSAGTVPLEAPPQDPPKPSATSGAGRAGNPRQHVPDGTQASSTATTPASPSPAMPASPRRSKPCTAGVTPCGQPARPYPAGWRCDQHRPGREPT